MDSDSNDIQNVSKEISQLDAFFDYEIERSKHHSNWGRQLFQAMDNDSAEDIAKVINNKSLEVNINEQTTTFGFGEYLWTREIHKYLGDTILHLALKLGKFNAVYILLLYEVDITIKNANQETSNALCLALYKRTIDSYKREAYNMLLNTVNPLKYHEVFPRDNKINFKAIREEAYKLAFNGRLLSTHLPITFQYLDLVEEKKITKVIKPKIPNKPIWRRRFGDYFEKSEPYLENTITGERRELTENEKKYGFWHAIPDENGKLYYINELTMKVQETLPGESSSVDINTKVEENDITTKTLANGATELNIEQEKKSEFSLPSEKSSDISPSNDIDDEYLNPFVWNLEDIPIDMEEVRLYQIWLDADDAKDPFKIWRKKYENGEWKPSGLKARLLDPSYKFEHFFELQKSKRDERLKQQAHEKKTGINTTNGCLGLKYGDVWNKNDITDTIRLIKRQQLRHAKMKEILAIRECKKSMLHNDDQSQLYPNYLIDAAKEAKIPASSLEHILRSSFSHKNILNDENLAKFQAKLPFVSVDAIKRDLQRDEMKLERLRNKEFAEVKLFFQSQVDEYEKKKQEDLPKHRYDFRHLDDDDLIVCRDSVIYRNITKISTSHNLKYMDLSETNLSLLFDALVGDEIISHITLSNSRLRSLPSNIQSTIPTMTVLRYLDLSNNELTDLAIHTDFVGAILNSNIETLSLANNSLSSISVPDFIESALSKDSKALKWISFANNSLSQKEIENIRTLKRFNMCSFVSNRQIADETLSSPSVTSNLKIVL